LHLEARYNYEAIKTGSLWLGYNFSFGKKLAFEATPMFGGVFGDITGIAPGYTVSISYEPIEFFTQGEYFFDAGNRSGNFFYSWSELSCAPVTWFRVGIVVDRTKALGSNFDIRRGPLVGFKYKKVDFTTYWLDPGSRDATFIFTVALNFWTMALLAIFLVVLFLYSRNSQRIARIAPTSPILFTVAKKSLW